MTKILRFMPEFLREGSNLVAITEAVAAELEIAIDFINEMKKDVQISTASGNELDDIGSFFSLTRLPDEIDSSYRARIVAFISQSNSSGTTDDIKTVISNFSELPKDDIIITELGPGKILISAWVGLNLDLATTIDNVVQNTKAAGVYAFLDISAGLSDSFSITDYITISEMLLDRFYGRFVYGSAESVY